MKTRKLLLEKETLFTGEAMVKVKEVKPSDLGTTKRKVDSTITTKVDSEETITITKIL